MYLALGSVKLQQDSMSGGSHFSKVNPLHSPCLCTLINLKGRGIGVLDRGWPYLVFMVKCFGAMMYVVVLKFILHE